MLRLKLAITGESDTFTTVQQSVSNYVARSAHKRYRVLREQAFFEVVILLRVSGSPEKNSRKQTQSPTVI